MLRSVMAPGSDFSGTFHLLPPSPELIGLESPHCPQQQMAYSLPNKVFRDLLILLLCFLLLRQQVLLLTNEAKKEIHKDTVK